MVIRTEYHGQRYSIGSSDPLPVRFEIWFGSLNFQATGNDYLMRITNREELHARRQTGPAPSRRTCCWGINTRQHRCCGPLGASTPSTLRSALSTGADRMQTGCTHCLTA
jgi:hypothetical protein